LDIQEFDRLHVELLGAKRKAAELPLVQEQLQRQKQLWSEAEQRLAELQAAAARSQEEAAAKQATLSAQLGTARDELAAVKKEQKQLQQQLANAQDAVKVCGLGLACLPVCSNSMVPATRWLLVV
jgi:multidrug resistance efflux pump